MRYNRLFAPAIVLLGLLVLNGCASHAPYDYSALKASNPKSILVIPPANESVEVNAPYIYLSTITNPLAERGYYVFPVAVIDQFFKQNGLPTPEEMNQVPLDKINEIIGPDAVLYVTVKDWGQSYQVISSKAIVSSSAKLIDAKTGQLLWEGTAYAEEASGNGGGGLAGALISAAVTQMLSSAVDMTPELSATANYGMINRTDVGLLPGPYRPLQLEH